MCSSTQSGLNLIKQFEGFRAEAYPDPHTGGDPWTIGYGTTIYSFGTHVKKGEKISEEMAIDELNHYVSTRIGPALEKLPFYKDFTEPMIGALESFAYNLGEGFYGAKGFETISRRLREKDWKNMRSALMLYVNPGSNVTEGLKRRRAAEADLWDSGLPKAGIPVAPSHPPVAPVSNNLKPGYLSANFTLSELAVSQTAARNGIDNTPSQADQANLKHLCVTCLQPLRDRLGRPVVVSSGYRGPQVNLAVGGSKTSAHMFGRAADIHVPGMSNMDLMLFIHNMKLPVDQVIEEFGSWVHIGIADIGRTPRNQYLLARTVNGQTVYSNATF